MGTMPSENETRSGRRAAEESSSPAVAPEIRTGVYLGCLGLNVLSMVGFGLAGVFGWIDPQQGQDAIGIIAGGTALISSGLALGYRPTRST